MNQTITYYNQNAEEYFNKTVNVSMQALYDQFEAYLNPGDKILDLGCGSGRDSKYFLSKGYEVVSVDGSIEMCRLELQSIYVKRHGILLSMNLIMLTSLMEYGHALHYCMWIQVNCLRYLLE